MAKPNTAPRKNVTINQNIVLSSLLISDFIPVQETLFVISAGNDIRINRSVATQPKKANKKQGRNDPATDIRPLIFNWDLEMVS